MFRQHVGHQCFIPAPHLIYFLLLLVDLNFPQEQGAGELLHLQAAAGIDVSIRQAVFVFACQIRGETVALKTNWKTSNKQTYMSGKIIEADHHNEDHNCHCELGWHQIRPAKNNIEIFNIPAATLQSLHVMLR